MRGWHAAAAVQRVAFGLLMLAVGQADVPSAAGQADVAAAACSCEGGLNRGTRGGLASLHPAPTRRAWPTACRWQRRWYPPPCPLQLPGPAASSCPSSPAWRTGAAASRVSTPRLLLGGRRGEARLVCMAGGEVRLGSVLVPERRGVILSTHHCTAPLLPCAPRR